MPRMTFIFHLTYLVDSPMSILLTNFNQNSTPLLFIKFLIFVVGSEVEALSKARGLWKNKEIHFSMYPSQNKSSCKILLHLAIIAHLGLSPFLLPAIFLYIYSSLVFILVQKIVDLILLYCTDFIAYDWFS